MVGIVRAALGALLLCLCGCSEDPRPRPAPAPEPTPEEAPEEAPAPDPEGLPPVVRVRIEDEEAMGAKVDEALAAGSIPGAVVVVGRADGVVFRRAYGRRAVEPESEPMTADTIFDLASITKAVATATSVHLLAQRGELDLEARASTYLPAIRGNYTVEQLLLHTSGLPPVDHLREYGDDRAADIERIARTPTERPPGGRVVYSDLGYILLGEIVAAASERPLEGFVRDEIFEPLGMEDTTFAPAESLRPRIAPTERAERRDGEIIRGVVHDPRAYRLGGVAGHAGLFSTGDDLARYARMMLREGELEGTRLLETETVHRFTTRRELPNASRAAGWDMGRQGMSQSAFGHGGFTGTSLWMDPEQDVFVIVLSNRVHPDGEGDVQPLVRVLGPVAVQAARNAGPPSPSSVLTGIDVLERDGFEALEGARVALLTHRAARARDGRRTLDVLFASDVEVVRVLAPEHGLGSDREGAHRATPSRSSAPTCPVHRALRSERARRPRRCSRASTRSSSTSRTSASASTPTPPRCGGSSTRRRAASCGW